MKNKLVLAVSIILTCLPFISFAEKTSAGIWNGTKVTSDAQFPFVVAVYNDTLSTDGASCTGTLVSKQWVLTASHCVVDPSGQKVDPSQLFIATGFKAGIPSSAEQILSSSQAVIYNNAQVMNLNQDIALIKLSKPLLSQTVSLPTSSNEFPTLKTTPEKVVDVGFGWTAIIHWDDICKTDSYSTDCGFSIQGGTTLRYGDGLTQSDENTIALLKKYTPAHENHPPYNSATMLGVISPNGNRLTNGDSGGPLLISQNGNYVQIGVASWGIPPFYNTMSTFSKEPSVYAALLNPQTLKFIQTTIA